MVEHAETQIPTTPSWTNRAPVLCWWKASANTATGSVNLRGAGQVKSDPLLPNYPPTAWVHRPPPWQPTLYFAFRHNTHDGRYYRVCWSQHLDCRSESQIERYCIRQDHGSCSWSSRVVERHIFWRSLD